MGDSDLGHLPRYQSPRWSGEICDCSLPMTFDTYSNCSFGCCYCFAQYQRAIGGEKKRENYRKKRDLKAVDVEKVKRIFRLEEESQFSPYIKARKTLQWGGLSDQFDNFERRYGVTLELLRFFKEIGYPITFSTKSVWWTEDERYMELFRGQRNWNVKVSIITLDEDAARRIEKGVPSPSKRIEALRRVAEARCGGATLRLRPFIIGVSSRDYEELIRRSAAAGADAVTTEFFCMESRATNIARKNYAELSDVAGFDIVDFYRKYSHGQGYLRLNRELKRPYVERMRDVAHASGMRFYVSDAHFKEASDGTCCCGLPDDWNFSRENYSEALQLAKKNGEVHFSEISDSEGLFGFPWGDASGYNTTSIERRAKFGWMTMADYLRYTWNNPACGQSPYRMFGGVLEPNGWDDDGNVVYVYKAGSSLDMERQGS